MGRPKGFHHTKEWKEEHRKRMLLNNPFKGKKHTEETKIKMSQNHADFKGDKNPFKNSLKDPDKLIKFKNRCLNTWRNRTKERKEEIAKKLSNSIINSRFFKSEKFCHHHKHGWIESKKSGKLFYRSSWEKIVIQQLDEIKEIDRFTLEELKIEYLNSDNNIRYTVPDFIIYLNNKIKIMIEVKPIHLCTYKKNKDKIKCYKQYCLNNNIKFILFTEKNLYKIKDIIGSIYEFR